MAHIPRALLFPAPGLPKGHVVMGYDEHGHCPMFKNNACSIYEHRPRTCRTYDCRIFPATGIELVSKDKVAIARQVERWEFDHASANDRVRNAAVTAAATFLHSHPECFADGRAPANPTQLAMLAIEVHGVFLCRDETTGALSIAAPTLDTVAAEVTRCVQGRS